MATALVTLTIGKQFEEMAKLTHPSLKRYAASIGAYFHIITERKFPQANECYEKLQCRELLGQFDRIIYLDTDILVKKTCPNLFDIVPFGTFGAFAEGKVLGNGRRALEQAKNQGWGDYTAQVTQFFNAGVMIFDKTHIDVFTAPEVFHNNFWDNTWMCIQVMKHVKSFMDIGPTFDFMCSLDWPNRLTKAQIVHYAGNAKGWVLPDLQSGLFT